MCVDGSAQYEEFTFTDQNYTPRKINTYELITANYGVDASDNHCFDTFECYKLTTSIIMECSKPILELIVEDFKIIIEI